MIACFANAMHVIGQSMKAFEIRGGFGLGRTLLVVFTLLFLVALPFLALMALFGTIQWILLRAVRLFVPETQNTPASQGLFEKGYWFRDEQTGKVTREVVSEVMPAVLTSSGPGKRPQQHTKSEPHPAAQASSP